MSDLENEIEKLISEKKRVKELLETTEFSKNVKNKDYLYDDNLKMTDENLIEKNKLKLHNIESFKKENLEQLANAKTGHKKWMSYVQILIALGDVDSAKAEIPVNYTMCDFGKWYYGNGQLLNEYDRFEEIEEIHQQIHNTYLKIYNLYRKPLKTSVLKSSIKLENKRQKKAEKLAIVLAQYSKTLFDILNDMSDRLKKIPNKKLNEIIN